jgi:shikimate 5-dehydrogenase
VSVCFVGAGGAARAMALSIPFTCLAGCATAFTV